MNYVVKFGDQYSHGRPNVTDSGIGLAIGKRDGAWVTSDHELATKHAIAWADDAAAAKLPKPRVVKLRAKS